MKKTRIFKHIFMLCTLSFCFRAFSQSARPVVSGLETSTVSTDKIELRWSLPENPGGRTVTGISVYRDTKPVTSIDSMLPLAVLHPRSESYQDTVSDMREYFYAVVCIVLESGTGGYESTLYYDEQYDAKPPEVVGKPYPLILGGVNATVAGTRARGRSPAETVAESPKSERLYLDDELREKPLPYIDILDGGDYPEPAIDRSVRNGAMSLAVKSGKKDAPVMQSHVFQEDVVRATGGEDAALFDILKTSFINRRYVPAEKELREFIPGIKNQAVRDRATFYLGECCYYNGKFSDAVRIFVSVQDAYPALSRKWTDACLDLYEIEN